VLPHKVPQVATALQVAEKFLRVVLSLEIPFLAFAVGMTKLTHFSSLRQRFKRKEPRSPIADSSGRTS
jgi:hypothetical protein